MGKKYVAPMHTAEHVLNAAMVREFGCGRCFSAHINPGKSKCDYHFERAMTDDEARRIEAAVNEQLVRGLDVTAEDVSLETARETFDLGRLPDGVETVRVVRIGDFDSCPCIGDHVANTHEVGSFRITTHSYSDGVLRIRFKLEAAVQTA